MKRANLLNREEIYANSRTQLMLRYTAVLPMDPADAEKAINLLRTGTWYVMLRLHLHASSAYEVGKQLQPDSYNRSCQGGSYHHNLWVKYAKGEKNPGPRTVKIAADKVPDSQTIFEHPLWHALDMSYPIEKCADTMFRKLHPVVQRAIYAPFELKLHIYKRRATLPRCLTLLENHAGIDALCVAVILLREAHAEGRTKDAFLIGHSLHRILIMVSVMVELSGLGDPFIIYMKSTIFPLATHEEIGFDVQPEHMAQLSYLFNRTILQLEDLGKIRVVNGGPTHDWRKVITGGFGFDHHFGFQPAYCLCVPTYTASWDTRCRVGKHEYGRKWGFNVLCEFRAEPLMPDEVITQMSHAVADI